jgi:Ca-activated chloride channel homolog
VVRKLVLGAALACVSTTIAIAQVFRAQSDLVVLQVAVQDRHERAVAGLTQPAFQILEDRTPQQIQFFLTEDRPAAVGLVVDNSTSMMNKRDDVVMAAEAFARSSNPQDALFLVNFDEQVSFALPPSQRFTSDLQLFHDAVATIGAHGHTALYDAIASALERVNESELDQKALVVVSDGNDNRSGRAFQDVLDRALRSNVVIYAIGIYDPVEDANRKVLRKLADATGGLVFFPERPKDIGPVLDRISNDIRHRYTLGYVSTNTRHDGQFRQVQVVVTEPATRRRLNVRVRTGYLAGSDDSGK